MTTLRERIEGGLIGLLVGDALGVPYEFKSPDELPPIDQIEMTPPAGFERSWPEIPPATWSDDGAQALCLLASLLQCGGLDIDDFGRRLQNWRYLGYMAVAGDAFDVGNTSREVIARLASGVPASRAGARDEHSNGNGSLMRTLPIALWHRGNDAELARDAMRQSAVTHAHLRSQLCCALYALWARGVLEQREDPWAQAVAFVKADVKENATARDELDRAVLASASLPVRGTGYVVDCLWSAHQVCQQKDYASVVRAAVALGHDTDTTACVAGGIAGLAFGVAAIPTRWREALRERDTAQALLSDLLKRWPA